MKNSSTLNIRVRSIGKNGVVRVFYYNVEGIKDDCNAIENCFDYLDIIENYLQIRK